MNSKIQNYVDVLFTDIPRSKKAVELKEELLGNMNERFEDDRRAGMSETEAYSDTIANLGDVDEMLRQVTPDEDFRKQANVFSRKRAQRIAIGVTLYILGVVVLIGMACLGELVFHQADIWAIIGVLVLLLFAAVATGLIVYANLSMPVEFRDFEEQNHRMRRENMTRHEKTFEAINSVFWSAVVLIYLTVSFLTRAWDISWIIWPLAGVLSGIFKTVFEMRNGQ